MRIALIIESIEVVHASIGITWQNGDPITHLHWFDIPTSSFVLLVTCIDIIKGLPVLVSLLLKWVNQSHKTVIGLLSMLNNNAYLIVPVFIELGSPDGLNNRQLLVRKRKTGDGQHDEWYNNKERGGNILLENVLLLVCLFFFANVDLLCLLVLLAVYDVYLDL